jgi:hypothetical protein
MALPRLLDSTHLSRKSRIPLPLVVSLPRPEIPDSGLADSRLPIPDP